MNAESTQKSIKVSVVFQQKGLYQNFQRDKANKINTIQNHTLSARFPIIIIIIIIIIISLQLI